MNVNYGGQSLHEATWLHKHKKGCIKRITSEATSGKAIENLVWVTFTTIVLQGQMHTARNKYLGENKRRVPEKNEQRLPYLEFFRQGKVFSQQTIQ